jgi:glycosyltransferase involved in cell wall biosynthesis
MDLYVQPSLWEGLSLALLQAMGAGLPVAASRVSGSQEVIEEGVNGVLLPPADAPALAAAIRDLYHQPQTRELLGDAARRTVAQKYSQDLMLRRLEGLYLELWEQGKTA